MAPLASAKERQALKVHNSLNPGPPVPFVPIEEGKVSWYVCGPTVYDHSHLGHARNYVSTDIIRRIMVHYFGFNVNFVMNITDVDDKIILKARRQKLLELEKSKPYTAADLSKLAAAAFDSYARDNLPNLLDESDGSVLSPSNYIQRRDAAYGKVLAGGTLTGEGKPGDAEAKMKMHLSNLTAASKAIQENAIFGGADEILLPYLDSLYRDSIDGNNHSIFTEVTQYWENDFMQDMDALNVMRADVITRVTDYVPRIADFVQKIVEKGFAYEADGSVYFDIAAFEKAGNPYARLRPDSKNDKALQEEGEGSLSKNLRGKRGPGDFALWKKSKAGEPVWSSPWGDGRPGWHIECSVMASDVLGSKLDLHSGGIDLAFPHHDNELAQSEAFYCEHGHEHNWVNYFMHMGHLSISGSKMSKSLKNFQTIRDALTTDYTPRSMRTVFLLGRWNDGVEISPEMRMMATSWEKNLNNFFINVKSHLLAAEDTTVDLKDLTINGTSTPDSLQPILERAQSDTTNALLDSFDTPRAMRIIEQLITQVNVHMQKADLDIAGLEKVGRWVTQVVDTFGLDEHASFPYNGIGWTSKPSDHGLTPERAVKPYVEAHRQVSAKVADLSLQSSTLERLLSTDVDAAFHSLSAKADQQPETLALPYIRNIASLRDEIRKLAATSGSKSAILALSDDIRDNYLTNLGIYLDDRPDQGALIKFVPREELLAQKEEKAAKEREKVAQKEAARVAREKVEAEKATKARMPPSKMFLGDERFSAWDERGMPTKTKDGEDVPKSALKKLAKDYDRQQKLYDAHQGTTT